MSGEMREIEIPPEAWEMARRPDHIAVRHDDEKWIQCRGIAVPVARSGGRDTGRCESHASAHYCLGDCVRDATRPSGTGAQRVTAYPLFHPHKDATMPNIDDTG